jgi:hypothetical protein
MPKGRERRALQHRGAGHQSGHKALLDVVWEALNVARENKALVMACSGTIININRLAEHLCGAPLHGLKGTTVSAKGATVGRSGAMGDDL